jgi:hypothetical protein
MVFGGSARSAIIKIKGGKEMNLQDRLKLFSGDGFTLLGAGENNETLIFRKYDDGSGLLLAVHEKYTTQIKMDAENIKRFCACALGTTEPHSEAEAVKES